MIRILVTGLPRSGSTFIWQLINDTVGSFENIEIHKFHGGLKGGRFEIVFSTYRDPRNILISAANSAGIHPTVGSDINDRIDYLFENDWFKNYYEEFFKTLDNKEINFIRYEDYLPNNSRELFDHILKILSNKIDFFHGLSEQNINEILSKRSIKNNKKIAKRLNYFANHDKNSKIHGNHITSNGHGDQINLPLKYHNNVKEFCIKLGYL